ncbi:hypothetical protein BDB00DRAFT_845033 [Zychaea mexicana]|uniref:uncharacterized protein n=1 Tax=Zychaea mexicana TaxID=64656 RepID=UPI0022FDE4C2|nr:uncharacterized protein BDB00DRAFT_845033 [Zychaea mexicana]KAI9489184.1 hypothetical protein BDB00DRAFT_845033 [Zychaea mexicana]
MPNDCNFVDLLTSDNAWTQYLEKIEEESKQGHHSLAIDASCRAIDAINHLRLLILYQRRAMAYAKNCQIQKALDDASLMMRVAPHSTQGYICASEIYMMWGKAGRAVEVLEDAVNKTTPGADSSTSAIITETETTTETELKARLCTAKECHEKRVDFITSLPTEIMMQIFGYLNWYPQRILKPLCVSKAWRARILGCPNVWEKIVALNLQEEELNLVCGFLPIVSSTVKELELSDYGAYTKLFPIFAALAEKRRFCNFRKLTIHSNRTGFNDPIFSALLNVGAQLTKLSLILFDDEDENMMPSLFKVLELCPNIQDLIYGGNGMLSDIEDVIPRTRTSHGITRILLLCSYLSHGAFEFVLRRCQHLRVLNIKAEVVEGGTEICSSIQELGTHLQAFAFNNEGYWYNMPQQQKITSGAGAARTYSTDYNKAKGDQTHDSGGLLQLRVTDEIYWLSTLVPLLSAHHETLQELDIPLRVLPVGGGFNQQLRALGRISFPSLRKLAIRDIQRTHSTVADLIKQCGMLQSLCLSFADDESAQRVFIAMADNITLLRELEELEIVACNSNHKCSIAPGLTAFFEAFQALGVTQSRLRRVKLEEVDLSWAISSCSALSLLASLPTIRIIELIRVMVPKRLMDQFAQKVQEAGTLEELKINELDELTLDDDTFQWFAFAPSLKSLALLNLSSITDDCLSYFEDNPEGNLKALIITECPLITSYGLQRIDKLIPKVYFYRY